MAKFDRFIGTEWVLRDGIDPAEGLPAKAKIVGLYEGVGPNYPANQDTFFEVVLEPIPWGSAPSSRAAPDLFETYYVPAVEHDGTDFVGDLLDQLAAVEAAR